MGADLTPERATVVVPTYGRPDGLVRLLRGLGGLDDPGVPWDVVVVDNNTSPEASHRTAEAFGNESRRLSVPARLVHETRTGASHARNRGVAEASGSIVVFIDDDVVPDRAWLRALLEPILAGRCVGTGGRVVLDPSVPRPAWFTDWMPPLLADFQPGDGECDVNDLVAVIGRPFVLTASAAFRAGIVRAVGGFDSRLGPREGAPTMCDDLDLCLQIQEAGGVIRYVPSSIVVHDLPASRLSRSYLVKRSYWHGRSNWILNEADYRKARFGGVRSMVTRFLDTWRQARRNGERQITLRLLFDAAYDVGLLHEAVQHARGGLRGWHDGASGRTSDLEEQIRGVELENR